MNWAGRVAVITGGASGIGEGTAREFAVEDASVAILDINAEAGERIAAELRTAEHQAAFYPLDVADRDACGRVVATIASQWGRVDYLVNSAVSFLTKGLDATTEDWERSLGVNVRGSANMAQACYPYRNNHAKRGHAATCRKGFRGTSPGEGGVR